MLSLLLAPAGAVEPIRVHPSTMDSIAFARIVEPDALRDVLPLDESAFAERVVRALARLDYDVRVNTDRDVFADDRERFRAGYQLGATLTDAECREDVWPYACEVAVRWQLYENHDQRVVYEVTTRGLARGESLDGLAEDALDLSLASLLTRQAFVDAQHKRPDPGDPPPDWRGELAIKRCVAPTRTLPTDLSKMLDAVVVVGTADHIGSGVLISPDGYVVTAAHVVHADRTVGVALADGRILEARVLRIDEGQDVAVVKVDATALPCAVLAITPPTLGSDLYAVGFPLGFDLDRSVSRGIVSGLRTFEDWHYVQTDAAINRGNSGGPLLDRSGRIVGIVSYKVAMIDVEGLAFGVPNDALVDRLDLVIGDASDPDPLARIGERAVIPDRPLVTDPDDPPFLRTLPAAARPAPVVAEPPPATVTRRRGG